MKRIAFVLGFGFCAVSSRGAAEPRISKVGTQARHAAPLVALAKREVTTYANLVAFADADGDAHVSGSELEAMVGRAVEKRVASRFRRLDRNQDGRVERAEVPTMLAARFLRFDRNSDGAFTIAELTSVVKAQALERCRLTFVRLDQDGDGTLSLADAGARQPTLVTAR